MCKKNLQKEAQTLRSSKETKDFASQLGNMLGSKNMVIHTKKEKIKKRTEKKIN